MKARNFTLVFIVLFVGMAVAASAIEKPIPEPLLGFELDGDDFRITVAQKGGTNHNSFRFDIRKSDEGQFITVVRIVRDECKMMPQREVLTFMTEDIGIDPRKPVFITNSFVGYTLGADMRRYDLEKKVDEPKPDALNTPATLKEKAVDVFKKIGND
jgi:hypothetical protein